MSELLEVVAIDVAVKAAEKCPFTSPQAPPVPKDEQEHPLNDDSPAVAALQVSKGGTLGKNLTNASNGASNTVNDLFPADQASPEPPCDTKRNNGGKVDVEGDPGKQYPFTLAAHHLIPGNASLAKSRLYKKYMVKDGQIKTRSGKEFKIKEHIGYNVNGAHNGVWLAGNYAIRKRTSPKKGSSWSALIEDSSYANWCFNYMLACVKKTHRQFHDTHTTYSEKVLGILNKIHRALVTHQDACSECAKKTDPIPAPYVLKTKLYAISRELSGKLREQGGKLWKMPWYTSDRFKDEMIKAGILSY